MIELDIPQFFTLILATVAVVVGLGVLVDELRERHMDKDCLLYTSPSPRDLSTSRMPSSA